MLEKEEMSIDKEIDINLLISEIKDKTIKDRKKKIFNFDDEEELQSYIRSLPDPASNTTFSITKLKQVRF
jgi:hypothetical protein